VPREVFVAGQILTAAEMNIVSDQTVMVFSGTAARGSAIPSPVEGMVTYLSDSNLVEAYTGAAFTPVGKVLQVVEATDSTDRTTTSTSMVDAGTLSVTITPSSAASKIYVTVNFLGAPPDQSYLRFLVADGSNVTIGAADSLVGADGNTTVQRWPVTYIVSDSPGSTSAKTYKLRFRSQSGGSTSILNSALRGRIIAMEVAG
jgi:hypothetical protein